MITSILMLLQNIAHFDNLISIRKFTEITELLNDDPLYTIFRKTPDK
jgi:hypothetical protein